MALTRTNGGARPADGSSFGNAQITGRQLTHYTITSAGMFSTGEANVNFLATDSDYEKLVLAIGQVASIELLGAPQSGNVFRVALSGAAPSPSTGLTSLQAFCNTAVNGSGVASATVAAFTY